MSFRIYNEVFYLNSYPDVRAAVAAGFIGSGLEHFQRSGINEGRVLVSPFWNEAQYLAANPDVRNAVTAGFLRSGLQHYILFGENEGRPGAPSPALFDDTGFNENYYLSLYPDVAAAVARGQFSSAESHYIRVGHLEGRTALFSGAVGDDIIGGTGERTGIAGVAFDVIANRGAPDPRALSFGVGEIDLLTGSAGSDTFLLGVGRTGANPVARSFYVGQGDADFAYIKNFERNKDYIQLAGRRGDYGLSVNPINVGGVQRSSVSIFTLAGDRVAVVEGISELRLFSEDLNQGIFFLT